jgi:hypothetical protein
LPFIRLDEVISRRGATFVRVARETIALELPSVRLDVYVADSLIELFSKDATPNAASRSTERFTLTETRAKANGIRQRRRHDKHLGVGGDLWFTGPSTPKLTMIARAA